MYRCDECEQYVRADGPIGSEGNIVPTAPKRHKVASNAKRHSTATPRTRGRALQRMRKALFSENPLCVVCLKQGRTELAVHRDHIVPLIDGGRDDASNEQGLCEACHAEKTAREATMRGVSR